jgi:hypothetical protein
VDINDLDDCTLEYAEISDGEWMFIRATPNGSDEFHEIVLDRNNAIELAKYILETMGQE